MGKLVNFQADGSAVEIKLDRQRITIGRRPDNDVCLPYPAVSGEHAMVVTILDDSFLQDLGSTNGTLVNGAAVAKYFLRDRDEIDIGRHILVYVADDAATIERPRKDLDAAGAAPLAAVRAKRRSDVVPAVSTVAEPVASSSDTVDEGAADPAVDVLHPPALPGSEATMPDAPAPVAVPARAPERFVDVEPALKVMSGAKAGRIVALIKDETLIGRAGVQVAALRRIGDEVRIVPIEGATPPSVNGVHVVPEGQSLAIGDILEIAGAKLEVIAPAKRSSA